MLEHGHDIAFRTLGGEGPDCLLIHGFGSDRLSWLGNTPAILPLVTVHALDLPGHGESGLDVGDGSALTLSQRIEAVIAARQLSRLHIVAHSLGGGIGLLLAARRPDLVASLALVAPAGLGVGIDPEFLEAFPEAAGADTVMALLRKLVVRPHLIGRQTGQRVLEQLAAPGAREALRLIAAELVRGDTTLRAAADAVAAAGIPRLVIWGAEDQINPLSSERLSAFGGEFHVIAGTAHLPHIESGKLANEYLAGFLSRVAKA